MFEEYEEMVFQLEGDVILQVVEERSLERRDTDRFGIGVVGPFEDIGQLKQ